MKIAVITTFSTLLIGLAGVAHGAITVPSDGSDGELNPGTDITIDLSLAATGTWSDPGSGNGVYDPDQWAVFFKYSSITVANNRDITFINHPSGAPVVWLSQGDVTITGIVHLDGEDGAGINTLESFATGGPGGFRGGKAKGATGPESGGHGPGGGSVNPEGAGGAGSYATMGGGTFSGVLYGNTGAFPLIGGSGGAGTSENKGGGAGGGALLIATPGTCTVNGSILARGGTGGNGFGGGDGGSGSGGAIRIIASNFGGNGLLSARGGQGSDGVQTGGDGRISVEAEVYSFAGTSEPLNAFSTAMDPLRIARDTSTPSVRVASVAGELVDTDPRARFNLTSTDVELADEGTATVIIEGENIANTSTVTLRIVRAGNTTDEIVTATFVSETGTTSTWTVDIDVSGGFSALQASAQLP
jgi:hypothetical protein